jgi:TP901 family phage tail tape measure protein
MEKDQISLLFGVLGGGSVSGESGQNIKNQIDSIVKALNNKANTVQRGLAFQLDVAATKSKFTEGLKAVLSKLSEQKQFKLKVSQIDASAAVKGFKQQLESMLKTVKVSTGFTVTVGENGAVSAVRQLGEEAKVAEASVYKLEATLKEINDVGKSITAQYKNAYKTMIPAEGDAESQSKFDKMRSTYIEMETAMKMANDTQGSATDEQIQNVQRLQAEMQTLLNTERERTAESKKPKNTADKEQLATLGQIRTLYNQIEAYLNKNTRARGSKGYTELLGMQTQLGNIINGSKELNSVDLENLKSQFNGVALEIKTAGMEGKSLGDTMAGAYEKFGGWMLVTRTFAAMIRQANQMVGAVMDIDAAMTELKKVTNETDAAYDKFLTNAATRAKTIGATITDTVSASADFARLGYSMEDASTLADMALLYKNVGDGIDSVDTASESLISTMQAFGIEASNAMSIVDKFNVVGNSFAISSGGVGESLIRSASALAFAGNSLDESIALITAANTTLQNPDVVGTTLKTISMYLRAAKVDAEEAGIATDGMASSVSVLRENVLKLTKQKVDIQIDDTTFKSSYEIIKEISAAWETISDIDQAALLELLGGKRNSNAVSALIENFEIAEEVIQATANSAGKQNCQCVQKCA